MNYSTLFDELKNTRIRLSQKEKELEQYKEALRAAVLWIDNRIDYSDDGCRICPLYKKCTYETNGRQICVSSIENYFLTP